jgi:uncharacterized protein
MPLRNSAIKINPRSLSWDYTTSVRKYWFDGSPALTHLLNVYTLLVPDNERYYIRALTPCLDLLDDPEQRTELLQFFRQESLHGVAHQKYWKQLEAQGCRIMPFVKGVDLVLYRLLEPLQPQRVRVAIVAAIEHINAFWGHEFLHRDLLAPADTALRELFSWHFAEEIEHKAVAHRALTRLYPGYGTRLVGALLAFPLFYLLVASGTAWLLAGDGELLKRRTWRDLGRLCFEHGFLRASLSHMWRYLKPGFEPWTLDDSKLSVATLSVLQTRTLRTPAAPTVQPVRIGAA